MKRLAVFLVVVAVAAACFFQAGRLHENLLAQRVELLPGNIELPKNTTPLVAFVTVALGGFRGLIADALWLRTTRMQEEGRYFELVQLADWITKLEPRFTPVWSFHAWNLAFNVSVLMNEPADRWQWVSRGIEMLRDNALVYNPGDAKLYWELGWMYQFKVGHNLDQAHLYYKRALVEQMATVFEGARPDFDVLANAPASKEALLAEPGAKELMDQVRRLKRDPFDPELLAGGGIPEDVAALLQDHPAAELYRNFLRLRRLREVYKMEPAAMKAADEAWGPLDWRAASTHATYWAEQGKPHASGFIALQLDRMVFQSMREGFLRGNVWIDPYMGNAVPSPNVDLLPRVRAAYLTALEEHDSNESMRTAHGNFLRESFSSLLGYGRKTEARDIFEALHERYPDEHTERGFDYYAAWSTLESYRDVLGSESRALVEGLIAQSLIYYAMGDDARAEGSNVRSRIVHAHFMGKLKSDDHIDRVGLPPYEVLQRKVFNEIYPSIAHPEAKNRLDALRPPPAEADEEESN
jgi:hypothetical protein